MISAILRCTMGVLSDFSPSMVICEDDDLLQDSFRIYLEGHADIYNSLREYMDKGSLEKFVSTQLHIVDLCHAGDPTGEESIQLIYSLREAAPETEIVVLSGISEVPVMRACLAAGADRYLLKDHITDELPLILSQLKEKQMLKKRLDETLVGSSHPIKEFKKELINARLHSNKNILIEGESGTGKEICAKFIYAKGPFVAVNVAAVPKGLFEAEFFGVEKGSFTGAHQSRKGYLEAAEGGTLFLDEIQSLEISQQAKLLRVLESRTFQRVGSHQDRVFKARLVCACNVNLQELIQKDEFREDLYYRIAVLHMRLPSLRARREDIPELVQHFFSGGDSFDRKKITPAAIALLCESYDWPGNVRELKAFLEKAAIGIPLPVVDAPEIQDLLSEHERELHGSETAESQIVEESRQSFEIDWDAGFDANVSALEAFLLKRTLAQYKGVRAREKLGLARSRYYEKLKMHRLK